MREIGFWLALTACTPTSETDKVSDAGSSETGADGDADGFTTAEGDCDDDNPDAFPGAEEICNALDDDCDGGIDEGLEREWYIDRDGDGYGDPTNPSESCEAGPGEVKNPDDCDDGDEQVHPGAAEECDTFDNDCDGEIDEDDTKSWYADADGDGFGDPTSELVTCETPAGRVADGTDCNDATDRAHPGLVEVCDTIDNDCDGLTDEDVTIVYYEDRDADGWGVDDATTRSCALPTGYAEYGGDCDDADAGFNPGAAESCSDPNDYNCDGSVGYVDADGDKWAACVECDDSVFEVNPGATEVCNDVDDNCDGYVDDEDHGLDLGSATEWHADADLDGFGDPASAHTACDAAAGELADATDCDDAEDAVNPDATEVCNAVDDDCDGAVDDDDPDVDLSTAAAWYLDADGDGYGDPSMYGVSCSPAADETADTTDCDDATAEVNPGAGEVCNAVDDDCDALVDDADDSIDLATGSTWYDDGDGDGYGDPATARTSCDAGTGEVSNASDCDDATSAVSPLATEVCNDVDDNCDGFTDDEDPAVDLTTGSTWYTDADGDGYGDSASTSVACDAPSGTSGTASDCDDSDGGIHPGASDVCDGIDNDCDGSADSGSAITYTSSTSGGSSCNGNYNQSVTISVCGCSDVVITGAFADYSDGSGGQVVGASVSASSSMSLTWDDCSSGCDCDLDVATTVSWSASKSGTTLTVSVSNTQTAYSAGNSIAGGYSITGYGTVLGDASNSYSYSCSF